MRKRNHHVSVWMNDAEYRHLKKQVEKSGLGIDPFIRSLVKKVEIRAKPPEEYAALLRELSAIGNNLNQIAYWANTNREVSTEDIQRAVQLAEEAWRLVKETL